MVKPKIVISQEVKEELEDFREYPRETYEDIVKKLIEKCKSKKQLK